MPSSLAFAAGSSSHIAVSPDDARTAASTPHRHLLAFVRGWSIDGADVSTLRSQLAALDADLTVVADGGVWSIDDGMSFSDRACGDAADTALLLGARTRGDALYVIDGKRVERYPLAASAALATTLAALSSRSENV